MTIVSGRNKIYTSKELISEASKKCTIAVQGSGKDLQPAKVAQFMLTTGNDKLNATSEHKAADRGNYLKSSVIAEQQRTVHRHTHNSFMDLWILYRPTA